MEERKSSKFHKGKSTKKSREAEIEENHFLEEFYGLVAKDGDMSGGGAESKSKKSAKEHKSREEYKGYEEIEEFEEYGDPSLDLPPAERMLRLPHFYSRSWKNIKSTFYDIVFNSRVKRVGDIIRLIEDFQIQNYLARSVGNINLKNLANFLGELPKSQRRTFLVEIVPHMAQLALKTEKLFENPEVELLLGNKCRVVVLTREQVGCILVHCFFCTLPRNRDSITGTFYNFGTWYRGGRTPTSTSDLYSEKLQFLMHYFYTMKNCGEHMGDPISYRRIYLSPPEYSSLNEEFWRHSGSRLSKVNVVRKGVIEDAEGALWVDFANKLLGGGAASTGAVQEEIMFLGCPEMFVSMLLSDSLGDGEAVVVTGLGRYGRYNGYSRGLEYAGDSLEGEGDGGDGEDGEDIDNTQILDDEELSMEERAHPPAPAPDPERRFGHCITAIDAIEFSTRAAQLSQFRMLHILRELNKAYIGFSPVDGTTTPLATGRWGCGAFRGNAQLKFLIQWAAASQQGRELLFYPFHDQGFDGLEALVDKLKSWTVGRLLTLLSKYSKYLYDTLIPLRRRDGDIWGDGEWFQGGLFSYLNNNS